MSREVNGEGLPGFGDPAENHGVSGGMLSYDRDLCITSPFDQFLRQAQILILEISSIFLWLKFSPSLNLNKIEHSAKVSTGIASSLVS